MAAIYLAPFYLLVCVYILLRSLHWFQVLHTVFRNVWVCRGIGLVYLFVVFSILIAFMAPASGFRRFMKLLSNYWLGVLMYTLMTLGIADGLRLLLKYPLRNFAFPGSSIITNVTARDLRKLEIKVGISYDSDIKKAKAILEEILHNDEDTKDDQGMVVFVDELGESAVVMGLRVWVATEKYWPARWRLNELIKEAFDANGIEIPYNQLQVHVKKQI